MIMSILKYIGMIILQIFVAIISMFVAITLIDLMSFKDFFSKVDSVSVANTFMVYVTFIVVTGTVAITIAGIAFTSWFSRQKEAIINENIDEVVDALLKSQKLKDKVLKEILNHKNVEKEFITHIESHLKSQKKDFEEEKSNLIELVTEEINNSEGRLRNEIKNSLIDRKDVDSVNDLISNRGGSNEK